MAPALHDQPLPLVVAAGGAGAGVGAEAGEPACGVGLEDRPVVDACRGPATVTVRTTGVAVRTIGSVAAVGSGRTSAVLGGAGGFGEVGATVAGMRWITTWMGGAAGVVTGGGDGGSGDSSAPMKG